MKRAIYLLTFLFLITSCEAQTKKSDPDKIVGGPCEGCEALFEYGNKSLNSIDTLPGFEEQNPKLRIAGTVFEKDGKTPASEVILYIYHTNRKGIYETRGDEKGWAKRHGFIRGWIKTGSDGRYTFYTFRPAAYPGGTEPEHIHITVKERGKNEYYIDPYLFDDDPILDEHKRRELERRGGSGIVEVSEKDGILTIERDIILGLNIPNYE